MNLKSIATLAASLVAAAGAHAATPEMSCGAGGCGKKESSAKKTGKAKKAVVPTKKEASCAKKGAAAPAASAPAEGGKDASCAKK